MEETVKLKPEKYPKCPECKMVIANLTVVSRFNKVQDGLCCGVSTQIHRLHTFQNAPEKCFTSLTRNHLWKLRIRKNDIYIKKKKRLKI